MQIERGLDAEHERPGGRRHPLRTASVGCPAMSGRFPFPDYPSGWYRVALSDQIRAGELMSLSYFGRELIAFRTDDGDVQVMEAHCPHLGAHIGVGGRVEGSCVVCPFHGWRF